MDELPVVRGLIVCERAEQDRRTGSVSVFTRFNRFRSVTFPSPPRLVTVYVALANGFGDIPLTLYIAGPNAESDARSERRVVRFADRLAELQLIFNLPAFSFPAAGLYEFTLYAHDEPLATQRVQVVDTNGEN